MQGSRQIVYQYYADKKGTNFKPYTASAASGILSIGVKVGAFGNNQKQAAIQSCIIYLGKNMGNIDGQLGNNTHQALGELGIVFDLNNIDEMLIKVESLVQQKFQNETKTPLV